MTEPEVSKRLITDYYRLHVGEVKAFVLKRMDYSAESEDIVHDIFLKLLESDKIVSAVTLPCLVYTMARNMIYDYPVSYTHLTLPTSIDGGIWGGGAGR